MDAKDWFVTTTSAAAALLGAVNAYINSESQRQIERLKTQIVREGEVRRFASDIMQRYDNVVNTKSDRATQLSRLEGLVALAGLIQSKDPDSESLDTRGILAVIRTQADTYKNEIRELSRTATGTQADVLQEQYVRAASVSATATAALNKIEAADGKAPAEQLPAQPAPAARQAPLDKVRVDIFWCSGNDESADALSEANEFAAKRPATSTAVWRVRALSPEVNARPGYNVRGRIVRYDTGNAAEQQAAAALARLGGGSFAINPVVFNSPNYISAFICPA